MGLQASGQARTLRFIALACSRWGRFAARLSHSGRCVFSGWRASDLVRATYEQSEFPRIVARWCPQRHSYPLVDLVRAVLERGRRQRQADASRRQVVPCAATCNRWRDQSCKLHVTTTPASATAVLEPSLAVLLRHRCAFKIVSTLGYAGLLNSTHYPSRGAGTFLRAYPDTDEPTELNGTLARLLGSTILFDHRPYRPGSLAAQCLDGKQGPAGLWPTLGTAAGQRGCAWRGAGG